MTGDLNLSHRGDQIRSFMGTWAMRPDLMRDCMMIYDIDTGLSGRQIAGDLSGSAGQLGLSTPDGHQQDLHSEFRNLTRLNGPTDDTS